MGNKTPFFLNKEKLEGIFLRQLSLLAMYQCSMTRLFIVLVLIFVMLSSNPVIQKYDYHILYNYVNREKL